MATPFYVGSYRRDALNDSHRGWIVGKFKDDFPRKTNDVEIMYWEFPAGRPTGHPCKESTVIECTFILKGKTRASVNGKRLELNAGDYVVISPGVSNNLVEEILEDAAGLTVKAPSDPTAKTVIS